MTLYRDNPNLKLKTVVTVSGNTEYIRNCRKIREKYYAMGIDCVEIDGKWYANTSKMIIFDHELQKYVLVKGTELVYGVVGFDDEHQAIFGYFTENKYKNVFVFAENYGTVKALNEELLSSNQYAESLSDGVWRNVRGLTKSNIDKIINQQTSKVYRNKGYNIEDNTTEFKEKIVSYEKFPHRITTSAVKYGKMLGETTFGAEIETSSGFLPDNLQHQTGVVICRDGSIDNAEYVTVPMKGAKGLVNIKNLSSHLTKRTNSDIRCSFHLHLGSLPKDRAFIVALYALSIRIQDEIFKMFPYYKTAWEGIKKQNYNQKTRKLGIGILKPTMTKEEYVKYVDDGYYRIFTWLNDGNPPDDNYNRVNHRHRQTQKWNRKQRYHWLNFMNLFFSERNTAEFRLHHNTLNGQKMVNWLFICNAIVRFAEKNTKLILSSGDNIKLDDILDYYATTFKTKEGKFLSEYLKAYVQDRKTYFLKDYKKNDYVSQKEQDEDKDYVFTYEGVSWLF